MWEDKFTFTWVSMTQLYRIACQNVLFWLVKAFASSEIRPPDYHSIQVLIPNKIVDDQESLVQLLGLWGEHVLLYELG